MTHHVRLKHGPSVLEDRPHSFHAPLESEGLQRRPAEPQAAVGEASVQQAAEAAAAVASEAAEEEVGHVARGSEVQDVLCEPTLVVPPSGVVGRRAVRKEKPQDPQAPALCRCSHGADERVQLRKRLRQVIRQLQRKVKRPVDRQNRLQTLSSPRKHHTTSSSRKWASCEVWPCRSCAGRLVCAIHFRRQATTLHCDVWMASSQSILPSRTSAPALYRRL